MQRQSRKETKELGIVEDKFVVRRYERANAIRKYLVNFIVKPGAIICGHKDIIKCTLSPLEYYA